MFTWLTAWNRLLGAESVSKDGPVTIEDRVARIAIVAKWYVPNSGADPLDLLTDILADQRHWADARGVDFEEAARLGRMHWEAEREQRVE